MAAAHVVEHVSNELERAWRERIENMVEDLIRQWPYRFNLKCGSLSFRSLAEVGVIIYSPVDNRSERMIVSWMDVEAGLCSLPDVEKLLVRASYWDGIPNAVAAKILNLSYQDFKRHKYHAIWHVADVCGLSQKKK